MCDRVKTTTSGVSHDLGLPDIVVRVVPHTGFEPVISALRGRCPGPLDECGVVHVGRAPQDSMRASAPQPAELALSASVTGPM